MTCKCFVFSAGVLLLFASLAIAGPKGDVAVRGVSLGSITIDGDFSDWPLGEFTKVAEQPEFPDAQIEFETNADGDHIVFDIDRVGFFNGTDSFELEKDGVQDYGIANYFAHDGEFLYVLGVVIDEAPRGNRDESEFGDGGFVNDGWEFFFDAKNDTTDDAAGNAFPAFDEEEPNLDDMQITFALNDFFLPDNAPDGALGARQHMERTGTAALLGPIDEETGSRIRNAPDEGGDSYRAFLDAAGAVDGNPDIAAKQIDDLRAAGALNPEIAANPDETFAGYTIEARIPFGIVPDFEPDHNVGFGLFWRDFDNEGDAGGASLSWIDWTQNEAVQCDEGSVVGLFCGDNWGELVFGEVPAIAADPLDCDGDGVVTVADWQCARDAGTSRDLRVALGLIEGDLDADGAVGFSDFLILSANFNQPVNDYQDGNITGNGTVGFADFLVLSSNFGQTTGATAAVPEPASCLLVLLGMLCVSSIRQQRA